MHHKLEQDMESVQSQVLEDVKLVVSDKLIRATEALEQAYSYESIANLEARLTELSHTSKCLSEHQQQHTARIEDIHSKVMLRPETQHMELLQLQAQLATLAEGVPGFSTGPKHLPEVEMELQICIGEQQKQQAALLGSLQGLVASMQRTKAEHVAMQQTIEHMPAGPHPDPEFGEDEYLQALARSLARPDTCCEWAYLLQRADTSLACGSVLGAGGTRTDPCLAPSARLCSSEPAVHVRGARPQALPTPAATLAGPYALACVVMRAFRDLRRRTQGDNAATTDNVLQDCRQWIRMGMCAWLLLQARDEPLNTVTSGLDLASPDASPARREARQHALELVQLVVADSPSSTPLQVQQHCYELFVTAIRAGDMHR